MRQEGSQVLEKKQSLPAFKLVAGFNQVLHTFGAGGDGEHTETIEAKS